MSISDFCRSGGLEEKILPAAQYCFTFLLGETYLRLDIAMYQILRPQEPQS
jgi:hypothetical protein